jgi:hypothetical protein
MAHAAAGAVFGRQEAGEDVGRQAGVRVDRVEVGIDLAGGEVDAGLDLDLEVLAVVVHRDGGLEVLGVGGDGDQVVAEADLGQGEGGPVEIGVELVGDGDDLGGGGGGGVVLEVDAVGERVDGLM